MKNRIKLFLTISLVFLVGLSSCDLEDAFETDIFVFGGMNISGLNTTESEHMIDNAIKWIAREFYIRMGDKFPDGYFNYKKG